MNKFTIKILLDGNPYINLYSDNEFLYDDLEKELIKIKNQYPNHTFLQERSGCGKQYAHYIGFDEEKLKTFCIAYCFEEFTGYKDAESNPVFVEDEFISKIDGKTYIVYSSSNFSGKTEYYLRNTYSNLTGYHWHDYPIKNQEYFDTFELIKK